MLIFNTQVCLKLFDKDRGEDHACAGLENTGHELICHLHDGAPVTFKRQADLDTHLGTHAPKERDAVSVASLKISCPVCHKVKTNCTAVLYTISDPPESNCKGHFHYRFLSAFFVRPIYKTCRSTSDCCTASCLWRRSRARKRAQ
jgi:hypothetical protein